MTINKNSSVIGSDITNIQNQINQLRVKHSLPSLTFTNATGKILSTEIYELKNGIKSLENSKWIGAGKIDVSSITNIDIGNIITAVSLNNIQSVINNVNSICANNAADYAANYANYSNYSNYSSNNAADYSADYSANYANYGNYSSNNANYSNYSSNNAADYAANNANYSNYSSNNAADYAANNANYSNYSSNNTSDYGNRSVCHCNDWYHCPSNCSGVCSYQIICTDYGGGGS